MPLARGLVDDADTLAVMLPMRSGEYFIIPTSLFPRLWGKKPHQTLSARESTCIMTRQDCTDDNFTGNLELDWRKERKKHHGEHSCTSAEVEQMRI